MLSILYARFVKSIKIYLSNITTFNSLREIQKCTVKQRRPQRSLSILYARFAGGAGSSPEAPREAFNSLREIPQDLLKDHKLDWSFQFSTRDSWQRGPLIGALYFDFQFSTRDSHFDHDGIADGGTFSFQFSTRDSVVERDLELAVVADFQFSTRDSATIRLSCG